MIRDKGKQMVSLNEPVYDVAIVGAGPAGLSAAVVLGRCRRTVVVCDSGNPRNGVARAVHGYLGLDDIRPSLLRSAGRSQAAKYGVQFHDAEVVKAAKGQDGSHSRFELNLGNGECVFSRKILLATGVKDRLPSIPYIEDFYGKSVFHCPYCDGWEHRDKVLAAVGQGKKAVGLALLLKQWSPQAFACTDGHALDDHSKARLRHNHISYRDEPIVGLRGFDGQLEEIIFADEPPLRCDVLFFDSGQQQQSRLPKILGCRPAEAGHIQTGEKQGTGVRGVFLAGDADGDVQFAIVAAAEGAVAATAINRELQEEDQSFEKLNGGVPCVLSQPMYME